VSGSRGGGEPDAVGKSGDYDASVPEPPLPRLAGQGCGSRTEVPVVALKIKYGQVRFHDQAIYAITGELR